MKKKSKLLIKDIGEVGLIDRISKLISRTDPNVVVAIGDDAAVVETDRNLLQVLTTDILVENVHFRTGTYTPFEIGYKAIVANVSDIAAMAALPRFALVSLGLDAHTAVDFVEDFYKGALEAADEYSLTIVGGDTTRSDKLVVNVAVFGQVEPEMIRRRSEAQVGDQIVVTEHLGGSAAGLYVLSNPKRESEISQSDVLKKAHLMPKARVREARIAAREGAHAMEDVSDGLASEIRHICELSKVGAEIKIESIPIAPGVEDVARLMETDAQSLALYGGEDFELVFTIPRFDFKRTETEIQAATGTTTTIVGEIVDSKTGVFLSWFGKKTTDITGYGFEHF